MLWWGNGQPVSPVSTVLLGSTLPVSALTQVAQRVGQSGCSVEGLLEVDQRVNAGARGLLRDLLGGGGEPREHLVQVGELRQQGHHLRKHAVVAADKSKNETVFGFCCVFVGV